MRNTLTTAVRGLGDGMGAVWRIRMLGGLRALTGEQVVSHFESRKTAALLAYLAYTPGRSYPREVLQELLWPEEPPDLTRPRFRQTLAGLRRLLEPEDAAHGSILAADRVEVHLVQGAVTTDVAEYEALLAAAGRSEDPAERIRFLQAADRLYGGELLPGHYEEWIVPERARLADRHLNTLEQLSGLLAERGELADAIQCARRALAGDPLREDAHRRLMVLYARAGRPADARRQYLDLERILKAELGVLPAPETRSLLRDVECGTLAGGSGSTGPQIPPPESRKASPPCSEPLPAEGWSLEPVGGAVALDSPYYLARPVDSHFHAALERGDSIVLVKGPRQVGKTSLLARGLQQARRRGRRVVLSDFQTFTHRQLADTDALFLAVAERMAEELDLAVAPEDVWDARRGWNVNFERYLRRDVLGAVEAPLVWGMDEVDRLFPLSFASEVFGLFRSWHNARSLHPEAPWSRLTLAIAYATEAHLFITDLNQSPFNVGTRLVVEDFTREDLAELNRRYGAPLGDEAELARFFALVGGHPYLVRRAFHEMKLHGFGVDGLEARAVHDESPFSDHLRRLLLSLQQDLTLCETMCHVLQTGSCPSADGFYRLRSAGLIRGSSAGEVRPRCGLYRSFLQRHLLRR